MSLKKVHLKNGNPIRYDSPRPDRVGTYIPEKSHTAVLVIKKKSTDPTTVAPVTRSTDLFFRIQNPSSPAKKKLAYTEISTPML